MKFHYSISVAAMLVISSSSAWAQSVPTDIWITNGQAPYTQAGAIAAQAVYKDYTNAGGEETIYGGAARFEGNTQTGYDAYVNTKTRDVEFNYLTGEAYTHDGYTLYTFNIADGTLKSSIPSPFIDGGSNGSSNLIFDQDTDTLYASMVGQNIYEVNRVTGQTTASNKKFTHADTQNGSIHFAGFQSIFTHNLDIDPTTGYWFWDVNQGSGPGDPPNDWAIGWGSFDANGAWIAQREIAYDPSFIPRDFAISNNGNLYVTEFSTDFAGTPTDLNIYNFGNPEALFDLLDTDDDGIQDVLLDASSAIYINSRPAKDYDTYMGTNMTGMAVIEHSPLEPIPEPLSLGLVVLGGLTFVMRRNRKV